MSDNPDAGHGDNLPLSHPPKSPLWQRIIGWGISLCIILLLVAMLLPAVRRGGAPAQRTQCKNNLKLIMLAMHNYHDDWKVFPPAYTVDADGNRLHSWRTLILPYMDQQTLYKQIDLTKPWDDPVNEAARKTHISAYECPSSKVGKSQTTYLAIVGEDFAFHPDRPRSLSEFTDGPSTTVMIMEVPADQAHEWMDPRDADESMFLAFNPETKISHSGGIYAAMGDGTVRFLSASLPAEPRRALLTISAGDQLGEF